MEQTTPVASTYQLPQTKSIIKKAWIFYKENFKKLWPLFLLGSIGEMSLNYSYSNSSRISNGASPEISAWIYVVIGLLIIFAIFVFWSKIALYKSISDIKNGKVLSVKEWYKSGANLFWGFVLVSILCSLVKFGGFILLIVPGLILSIYLVFSQFEYVNEGKKGFQALLSSWSIVKGRWWETLWALLLLYLFLIVPTILIIGITIAIAVVICLVLKLSIVLTVAVISIIAFLFIAAILLIITPLTLIGTYDIYLELKNNPIEQRSEVIDKKRKKKLIVCLIVLIPAFIALMVVLPKIDRFVNENISYALYNYIPSSGQYSFENQPDMYSLEYPTTWGIYNEVLPTKNSYQHAIFLAPLSEINSGINSSSTITTLLSVHSSPLPEEISNVEQFKDFILDSIKKKGTSNISNVKSTPSLFGIYPSIELELDEDYDNISTSTDVPKPLKSSSIFFIKNNYVFTISYSATPENFLKYSKDAMKIIESIYPYYVNNYVKTDNGTFREYVNKEYQFSINYPEKYYQLLSDPREGNVVSFVEEKYNDDGLFTPEKAIAVNIFRSPNDQKMTLDKITEVLHSQLQNFTLISTSSIALGGQSVERIHYSHTTGNFETIDVESAFTKKNSKVFRIDFYGMEDKEIDLVLSTFKLIETNSYAPNGMSLYQNKRFGTSIYVPGNWSYIKGPDETLTFADTFLYERVEKDPFTGVLSISVPDDAYVMQNDYELDKYMAESLVAWKKEYARQNIEILETGATTTASNIEVKYFTGEYDGFGTNKETVRLGIKQLFLRKNNIIRFVTFIDDKNDFLRDEKTMYEITKSFDIK